MESFKFCISLLVLQTLLTILRTTAAVSPSCPVVFREYIGALGKNVTFSDVPINPNVEFHFLLSFAIDYTNTNSPKPTNGDFLIYWDTDNLTPSHISSIKAKHKNVKVGMSLGGDTVNGKNATFAPRPACAAHQHMSCMIPNPCPLLYLHHHSQCTWRQNLSWQMELSGLTFNIM